MQEAAILEPRLLESHPAGDATAVVQPAGGGLRYVRLLVVGVVLLYLAAISSRWYITPDSSLYLLLGQSLSEGEGYAIFGEPYTKFPPGFPVYLAAMRFAGVGDMLWLNVAMVLMGLAAIGLSYLLLREHASALIAVLAVFAFAVGHEMYGASIRQLSDVPFALLVLAGLLLYRKGAGCGRGWLELGTLALVASCSVRVVGMSLALSAAAGLVLENWRGMSRRIWINAALLVLGVASTALALYGQHRYVQTFAKVKSYSSEMEKAARRPLWQPVVNFYETGEEISRLFSGQEMPALPALVLFWPPILVGMWLHLRDRHYVTVFATAGYVGSILVLRALLSRYLLPVAPLLLMYYFDGVRWLLAKVPALAPRAKPITVALACCLVGMNLPKDIRLAWSLHRPSYYGYRDDWPAIFEAADYLRANSAANSKFLGTESPGILAYLCQIPCLQFEHDLLNHAPDSEDIVTLLKNRGIESIVIDKQGKRKAPLLFQNLLKESGKAQVAFENDKYLIYRFGAEPRTGSAPKA